MVVGLIVLALLISYVPLSNDEVKEKIINSVAEQTGYQVEVTGSFDFYLSLTPGFEATAERLGLRVRHGGDWDQDFRKFAILALRNQTVGAKCFTVLINDG